LQVTFFAQSALTLPMQKHYHKVPRLYRWTYKGNKPTLLFYQSSANWFHNPGHDSKLQPVMGL